MLDPGGDSLTGHPTGSRPAAPAWSLTAFLTGLVFAMISIPAGITVGFQGKSFVLHGVQISIACLGVHCAISQVARRRENRSDRPAAPSWSIVILLLMTPAVTAAPDLPAALGGFLNFAFGVIGGALVGTIWAQTVRYGRGWIELGLTFYLVSGSLSLLWTLIGSGDSNGFHEAASAAWGNSNYVALTLVVGGLLLVSSGRAHGTLRRHDVVVAALAFVCAAMTYSRGGIIAAGVGIFAALWMWGPQGQRKVRLRLLAILILPLALLAYNWAIDSRSQVNRQVFRNVDLRLEMYRVALSDFAAHPLFGSGWLGLRKSAGSRLGYESAFAHNLILSFGQIAGILGLIVVVILVGLAWRGIRRVPWIAAPISAAMVGAMSDPFFEGTVGGVLAWSAIWLSLESRGSERGAAKRALTLPRSVGIDRSAPQRVGRISRR